MALRGDVLVGTDLSAAADEALRQAALLARHLDSRLLVCHVIPELMPEDAFFADVRRAYAHTGRSILAHARRAVQQQLETVLGRDNAAIDVVLEAGSAHVGLLSQAEAQRVGVVACGPGSAALDVVRHASCPVLVARPSPTGPVVGATDFSDPSLPALGAAAAEARRRHAPLHLFHAVDARLFALGPGHAPAAALPYLADTSPIALDGLDELLVLAKKRLDQALAGTGADGTTAAVSGAAADAIVRYAESVGAALVVVGTHGRSGFERLTLGSTAAAVIESAPCSVLVLRLAG